MTLSGAITTGQSGVRSYGNEGVLHIPQDWSLTIFFIISKNLLAVVVLYIDLRPGQAVKIGNAPV